MKFDSTSPLKLLVVEDNLTNQKVLLRQLQSLGYKADLAINGQMALDMSAKTAYHLILMDCRLPGIDGYMATRLIRQRDAAAPYPTIIIALTASNEPQAEAEALAAGMNDFLTKPLRRDLLADRLEHWYQHLNLVNRSEAEAKATAFYTVLRDLKFDLEQLQQLSDHSLEFEQELMQLYLDDFQVQLPQLQQAVSAQAWLQIEQFTHHIKGASASVGAAQLAQLAEALEQQAQQRSDGIQDLLKQLVDEFERAQQQLRPMLI